MQISWHPSCCSMTHQKHSPLSQRCDIFLKVTYKFPCFVLLAVENLLRPVQLISSEYLCVYSFSCVAPENSPGNIKSAQFYLKTLSHLLTASTSCSKAPLVPTFEVKLLVTGEPFETARRHPAFSLVRGVTCWRPTLPLAADDPHTHCFSGSSVQVIGTAWGLLEVRVIGLGIGAIGAHLLLVKLDMLTSQIYVTKNV